MKLWIPLVWVGMLPVLAAAQPADTLHVTGRQVVFFFPTEAARAAFTDADESAVSYDYWYHQRSFAAWLTEHSLPFLETSAHVLIVGTGAEPFVYERPSLGYGTLLTDGQQPPKLLEGVWTDIDAIHTAQAYFRVP